MDMVIISYKGTVVAVLTTGYIRFGIDIQPHFIRFSEPAFIFIYKLNTHVVLRSYYPST